MRDFLLELGVGFAFVGSQVHLAVGEQDFYVDLLFYHLKLRCFIVVELKAVPFEPSFAGMMNFYLSAVDDSSDIPPTTRASACSCASRKTTWWSSTRYATSTNRSVSPNGNVIVESLPKELKGSLPTVEQLEAEFSKDRD